MPSIMTMTSVTRNTLAVGAILPANKAKLMGSAILWDNPTRLCSTDAHVVLDCSTCSGALSPAEHGVAIGVGSADADVVWVWTARIVSISYPPLPHKPAWQPKITSWSFDAAPGVPSLDLAVLQIGAYLGSPSAPLQWHESREAHKLSALPLGDSDAKHAAASRSGCSALGRLA